MTAGHDANASAHNFFVVAVVVFASFRCYKNKKKSNPKRNIQRKSIIKDVFRFAVFTFAALPRYERKTRKAG